ncbi:MAG TPA: hypothetical protein VMC06_02240 [Opitutaceae bacterium]|nr:hypothetical protein [Opitutaceae bacterium]
MTTQLTADDARQSLNAHVAAKGAEIRAKYGPAIGWETLLRILDDRSCVRYPCEIAFDAASLQPEEFAHPVPQGAHPEDGFTLFVHPIFEAEREQLAVLVFYQLVAVNYGEFASPDDAITFGAAALGLTEDDYYRTVCELADRLPQ